MEFRNVRNFRSIGLHVLKGIQIKIFQREKIYHKITNSQYVILKLYDNIKTENNTSEMILNLEKIIKMRFLQTFIKTKSDITK